MSLPFLKAKRVAGIIISHRKPDGGKEEQPVEGGEAMEAAAEDILRAISSKDPKHLAEALHSAFQIMESMPHEENNEESEGSDFHSQNIKAAEDQE